MNIDNPLESLSKKELIDVIRMFSKNWLSLDGLWFTLVEDEYGLEAALDLDLKMWERSALIEARRIKSDMGIEGGRIQGVLKALRLMSFDPSMPFEYSINGTDEAFMWVSSCRPQEGRLKSGRGEFPCKPMGYTCYSTLASVIDKDVKIECVFCPPDDHPPDVWCKWRFIVDSKNETVS